MTEENAASTMEQLEGLRGVLFDRWEKSNMGTKETFDEKWAEVVAFINEEGMWMDQLMAAGTKPL